MIVRSGEHARMQSAAVDDEKKERGPTTAYQQTIEQITEFGVAFTYAIHHFHAK